MAGDIGEKLNPVIAPSPSSILAVALATENRSPQRLRCAMDQRASKLGIREARLCDRIERRWVNLAVECKLFSNEHDAVVAFRKNTPKWREAVAAMLTQGMISESKTK
jgi:hypothetical protein